MNLSDFSVLTGGGLYNKGLMESVEHSEERVGNGAVKRCNSSVGSPSPPPTAEQTNRIRHTSAMQSVSRILQKTKSCTSPVTTHDKDDDPNLQPFKRGRGHTISDMNPASRNCSTRSIQTWRPTNASTGSLLSAAFVSTASTTSLPRKRRPVLVIRLLLHILRV
ncbi:hypothetical protein Anas_13139 [Armadillidium nasatum]|uniref:Uncharacterized protein n=1 Tax=Armadillidium nasatum TaxID=96803 RepID=A0A5N5T535_9CRUS|nr:hypothetical protein Anas_13139 [Armadillidium nasatum]